MDVFYFFHTYVKDASYSHSAVQLNTGQSVDSNITDGLIH